MLKINYLYSILREVYIISLIKQMFLEYSLKKTELMSFKMYLFHYRDDSISELSKFNLLKHRAYRINYNLLTFSLNFRN